MSVNEEDPKQTAKNARKMPETEKVLRQFLSLESGNYRNEAQRRSWDLLHAGPKPLKRKMRCKLDGFVAEDLRDLEWHEAQCHHDPDHDFEPYDDPIPQPTAQIWCPACGGRHHDLGEWARKAHHTHLCETCGERFEGPKAVGV